MSEESNKRKEFMDRIKVDQTPTTQSNQDSKKTTSDEEDPNKGQLERESEVAYDNDYGMSM